MISEAFLSMRRAEALASVEWGMELGGGGCGPPGGCRQALGKALGQRASSQVDGPAWGGRSRHLCRGGAVSFLLKHGAGQATAKRGKMDQRGRMLTWEDHCAAEVERECLRGPSKPVSPGSTHHPNPRKLRVCSGLLPDPTSRIRLEAHTFPRLLLTPLPPLM